MTLGPQGLAAISFSVGFGLGTVIYPFVEPAVSRLVDTCMAAVTAENPDMETCKAQADEAFNAASRLCKKVTNAAKRSQCWQDAMTVYSENLVDCERRFKK